MTHFRQKTAGFTLVEMSIVIVIIGLIVGGVVASRSYIRNAELNTIMNESKYYINQFNQLWRGAGRHEDGQRCVAWRAQWRW